MQKISSTILMLIIAFVSFSQDATDLRSLQPSSDYLSGFSSTGNFEEYPGDDLFFLINGGAEIYHEYGFVKVLKSDYSNEGKSLSIEIYEMTDPLAAYGLYTMFRMRDDEADNIGDMGQVIDKHAMFIRDKYFVKINTDADIEECKEILSKASNGVSTQIGESSLEIPPLMSVFSDAENAKYLEGYLALSNNYSFITKDLFHFEQAVVGIYDDCKVFILEYESAENAYEEFHQISMEVEMAKKYSDYLKAEGVFSAKDKQDRMISGDLENNTIILIVNSGEKENSGILAQIRKRL